MMSAFPRQRATPIGSTFVSMRRVRVLVADDHAVLRAGLKMLLGAQPDMEVVAEAASGEEAVTRARETRPDVVLLDLVMPHGGVEPIRRLKDVARVLVLTMHDDPGYAREALAAGASGYIVKKAADVELLSAIRAVSSGRAVVDVDLTEASPIDTGLPEPPRSPDGVLSRRESQVLTLLAHGHTNREVAERLGISVKTAETYRARISDKLGLLSRADFVRYGVETGLLTRRGAAATQ